MKTTDATVDTTEPTAETTRNGGRGAALMMHALALVQSLISLIYAFAESKADQATVTLLAGAIVSNAWPLVAAMRHATITRAGALTLAGLLGAANLTSTLTGCAPREHVRQVDAYGVRYEPHPSLPPPACVMRQFLDGEELPIVLLRRDCPPAGEARP